MSNSHNTYPAPRRSFAAAFFASLGLAFGMLSIAEGIGAGNVAHDAAQQQAWNTDNELSASKLVAQITAETPSQYTSEGRLVVDVPEHFGGHPTAPVEPLRQTARNKRHTSEEYAGGSLGAFFVMGTSLQAARARRRRDHMALARVPEPAAAEPPQPRGATALGTMTVGLLPAGLGHPFGRPGGTDFFTIFDGQRELAGARAVTPTVTRQIEVRVDPVPPADEIDPTQVGVVSSTIYLSSTYDSGIAFLEQAMDRPPRLSIWQRLRHRIRTARAARAAAQAAQVLPPERRHIVDYSPLLPLDYEPAAAAIAPPEPPQPALDPLAAAFAAGHTMEVPALVY